MTADVTDRAFALVNALDASQQAQAVRGARAIDLVLGPSQPMRVVAPEGLKASALTAGQQALLVDLIGRYVALLNPEDAAPKLADVQSTLPDTYFAWYGPTAPGSAAYFRIQGPALWIEFAPQGAGGAPTGTPAAPDHVHAIYRDPTNEYGARWLAG